MTDENVQRVGQIYEAIGRTDIATVISMMTKDVHSLSRTCGDPIRRNTPSVTGATRVSAYGSDLADSRIPPVVTGR